VTLKPRVAVSDASAVDAVREALDDAQNACLVSRSVRSEVLLEPTVEVSGG